MSSYLWPNDDGWPYPDADRDLADEAADVDDDILALRAAPPQLFADLDPLERAVITSRFGLQGAPQRTMKQLHYDLGVPRADLREALGSALAKLRSNLSG
jgi:DNA-directed RNA polymerase sigma subunit (sigma70/sigma32)